MSATVCCSILPVPGGPFQDDRTMDTPHFFSDAVAEMDGDNPYPDIFSHNQLDMSSYTNSPRLAVDPMLLPPASAIQQPDVAETIVIPTGEGPADKSQGGTAPVPTRRSDRIAPGGQAMPPSLVQNSSHDSSTTQDSRPMTVSDASSRKSKSTSAASTPPPEVPAPRKRKSRKVEQNAQAPEKKKDGKKDKLLERNRIAASKCRQRKKEYVSELEDTKVRLETQHSQLQLEYHTLLDEVTRMKTDVMTHAGCNDPNIDRWIDTEARKYVQRVNQNCAAQNLAFGQMSEARRPSTAPSPYTSRRDSTSQENPATRRGSMAFSHVGEGDGLWEDDAADLPFLASSVEMSPIDMKFPMPSTPDEMKEEHAMNYDHMPDSMFSSPKPFEESGTTG